MNIQLTNMLSDVVGENGQKILRAIVAGERDGQVLVAMKNVRVRASADEIAKSPQGNWRTEHLFALKQALDAFDFVGTQLSQCDQQIELQLQRLQVHDGEPAKGKKCDRAPNAPKFDLRMGTSVVDVSMPFDRNRRFRGHGPLVCYGCWGGVTQPASAGPARQTDCRRDLLPRRCNVDEGSSTPV
jgi:hypothetical protein